MMQSIKYFLLVVLTLMLQKQGASQLTIQLQVPQAGMIQKSQLWNMSALYIMDDKPGVIFQMVITDRVSGSLFLTGKSSIITLKKGVQVLTEAALGPVTYSLSDPASNAGGSGLLPAGFYQVCYKVIRAESEGEQLAEECIALDVEAMSPPLLTLPEDSAILETQYPQFLWLPPTPVTIFTNLSYDIIISEVLPNQTPQEAVERNIPVYSMSGLKENVFVYSSSYLSLDTGKYYAWQIVAKNGLSYGAKSDAWIFKVHQPVDTIKIESSAYMVLSNKKETSAIYEAKGERLFVKYFSFDKEHEAMFQIYDGEKVVKEVKLKTRYGDNFLNIKLNGSYFQPGTVYLLQVKDRQGLSHSSPFIVTNN